MFSPTYKASLDPTPNLFPNVPPVWEHTFQCLFKYPLDSIPGQALQCWVNCQQLQDLEDFYSWEPHLLKSGSEETMYWNFTTNSIDHLKPTLVAHLKRTMEIPSPPSTIRELH